MSYLEELLPEFRKGAKIRCNNWEKDKYIQKKSSLVATDNDFLCSLSVSDIFSNRWELYQEHIDWQYIIKNKCLCWFWGDEEEERKVAGLLADYGYKNKFGRYKGENVAVTWLDHCRPVRRDEVTFYEDRDDKI